jgi:2-methylcitrate dehydratase PrpD
VTQPGNPPDISALARYALTPVDEVLADPECARWAGVRILDGLVNMWRGAFSAVSVATGDMMRRRSRPDLADWYVSAWPVSDRYHRADDAAFLMGSFAFSESYSDTDLSSVAHPGSVVVPAVLLASQLQPVSGAAVLAAVTVGYNIVESVGRCLNGGNPRMQHQLKGFRPTATVGPIAACAVLCRLAGLSTDATRRALSIACNQGGGLRRHPRTELSSLYVQSGEVLRRALHSVELAVAGVEGDDSMLFGDGGFMAAYSAGPLPSFRLPATGAPGSVATASIKLDCTPHTFISALDAARQLAERELPGQLPGRLTVRLPRQHWQAVGAGQPWSLPETSASAMYNLPFCVAAAFVARRHLYPRELAQALVDPAVAHLAPRVCVVADVAASALFDADPTTWPAIVETESNDGICELVEVQRPSASTWSAETTGQAVITKAQSLADMMPAPDARELTRLLTDPGSWADFWDSFVQVAPFDPRDGIAAPYPGVTAKRRGVT